MGPLRAPLFIIGCPRSGTTLLLDLLAGTRAFGYVNNSTLGSNLGAAVYRRNRIYDLPGGDQLVTRRRQIMDVCQMVGPARSAIDTLLPRAIEPWGFWEDLIPNFRPEFSSGQAVDPSAEDVGVATVLETRSAVAALLHYQRRDVLLSKYTDFPRIELMRAIFPGARFVHITRDAHAVANSYAVEIESGRFGTWAYRDWWAEAWTKAAREHWLSSGETVLGFSAHNRNHLFGIIEQAAASDHAVHTVSYERLTADPFATLTEILDFAKVSTRSSLDRLIQSRRVVNTNGRWRSRRTSEEIALLDAALSGVASREHTR